MNNILTGGTAGSDNVHGSFPASQGADGNDATRFSTDVGIGFGTPFPHYWYYDLGAGIAKIATKARIKAADISAGGDIGLKNFEIQGSNDGSAWTTLKAATHAQNENYQEYSFSNMTAYRFYRIYATDMYGTTYAYLSLWEVQLYENPSGARMM